MEREKNSRLKLYNLLKNKKIISIVGLEKNTGKTETLNFLIRLLNKKNKVIGLTSIGIDGEIKDQVTNTKKPEIFLYENTIFVTTENFYRQKEFLSEIIEISNRKTNLGRLIISRSIEQGNVILSGPSNMFFLKEILSELINYNLDFILIDGALSRISSSNPLISDGLILSTGAAVSLNIKEIVRKTQMLVNLINLEEYQNKNKSNLSILEKGIYSINNESIIKLPIESLLQYKDLNKDLSFFGNTFYIKGSITNSFLKSILKTHKHSDFTFIVDDYTKIFTDFYTINIIKESNIKIKVLFKANLIAITINPYSANGYLLNSNMLKKSLEKVISVPIIDIFKEDDL